MILQSIDDEKIDDEHYNCSVRAQCALFRGSEQDPSALAKEGEKRV
jgi:hypothetical protein